MCCKLLQGKVTTTAIKCLPVSRLSRIGTASLSVSLVQSENELLFDMILIGVPSLYLHVVHIVAEMQKCTAPKKRAFF